MFLGDLAALVAPLILGLLLLRRIATDEEGKQLRHFYVRAQRRTRKVGVHRRQHRVTAQRKGHVEFAVVRNKVNKDEIRFEQACELCEKFVCFPAVGTGYFSPLRAATVSTSPLSSGYEVLATLEGRHRTFSKHQYARTVSLPQSANDSHDSCLEDQTTDCLLAR